MSFMSQFSSNRDSQYNSPSPSPTPTRNESPRRQQQRQEAPRAPVSPSKENQYTPQATMNNEPQPRRERASSRPLSMVQTYQPPLMDVSQDTLPELQPIFTFLNSHANKLYQEGYFLKLDDQNTRRLICKKSSVLVLTSYSRQSQSRSNVDGMFCTACRNCVVPMGCCGTRYCGPRWRGSP